MSRDHPYPRRRPVRFVMRKLALAALRLLTDLRVVGRENLPQKGPLIVVANHFTIFDVAAAIAVVDWPMEFLGGNLLVDAPGPLTLLPKAWGYYAVRRGGVSRDAMRAASDVLAQDGVLAIFPEGGSWAQVLRPARPGTAYLAVKSGARILPLGLDGLPHIFSSLRQGRRQQVTLRIGQPFGPLTVSGRGKERRAELDALGDVIMQQIADLLPPETQGVYSPDPAIRAAAAPLAIFPYDDLNG